jgi:hypothetical protein
MALVAEIVDTDALLQTVWTGLAAGLGMTVCFSLVIVGAVRAQEARGSGALGTTLLYGLLGVVALLLFATLIVLGIVAIASKD